MDEEIKISEQASLHVLGMALGRRDEGDLDELMQDIKDLPVSESTACTIETWQTVRQDVGPKFSLQQKRGKLLASQEDQGLQFMRPEVLSQTLAKPLDAEADVREKNPNIRGRVAYSLPVYKENTRVKMHDLKSRMAAIGDKTDPVWQKLRKQTLALQDRLNRRMATANF